MNEPERPSKGQLTSLAIFRSDFYYRNQLPGDRRADWFDWVEREIGRRVDSNTKLTRIEAIHLITLLKGYAAHGYAADR